jgi:hypothetical protein
LCQLSRTNVAESGRIPGFEAVLQYLFSINARKRGIQRQLDSHGPICESPRPPRCLRCPLKGGWQCGSTSVRTARLVCARTLRHLGVGPAQNCALQAHKFLLKISLSGNRAQNSGFSSTLVFFSKIVGMDFVRALYALLACPRALLLLPNTYP